jgi:hypothetical protein
MSDKSAKALRATEKSNKAAVKRGPKSEIAAGKGKEKSGLKKPARKPKKIKKG